jgi:hypothetical protein
MQGSTRRYLLASVVYVGAALLLLCLAVFAGGFSRTVGEVRISGRFSPLPIFNRSRLEELTLSWNGLDLRFSRALNPGLVRMEAADGSTDIVFAGNERLRLSSPDALGSALTLSQVAAVAPPEEVLDIPFKVSGVLQSDTESNRLSWRLGASAFQLSLPSDSTIDYNTRAISLRLGTKAGLPEMRFVSLSPAVSQEASAHAYRLPDEKSLPTQDQLATSLAHFSDAAYAGWSVLRYSSSSGTWTMTDGSHGFSDEIGTGLLAESLARGTFASSLQAWANALDDQLSQNPELQVSFFTCVYSGRVRDFAKRLQDMDDAEVPKLKGLAVKGDPSLATQPGVLLYALDRGGPTLASAVLSSLRAQEAAKLPIPALLTVLEALEDYARYVGNDASVMQAARELIESSLLPVLTVTSDGAVFLSSHTGTVDVKQSIRCGSLLIRAGSLLSSSIISAFGRALIVSSLSLAADDGFLPASLSLASGRLVSRDGTIAPESVYMFLPLGGHVPHEVPLYRLMGSGCWVWTASDLASADDVDGEVRLVFSYPTGVPQHLVFRGLRPFQEIRMHGIPWHSDPSYAKYSDGWAYDVGSRTLFMKITGRADREEVAIRF